MWGIDDLYNHDDEWWEETPLEIGQRVNKKLKEAAANVENAIRLVCEVRSDFKDADFDIVIANRLLKFTDELREDTNCLRKYTSCLRK